MEVEIAGEGKWIKVEVESTSDKGMCNYVMFKALSLSLW